MLIPDHVRVQYQSSPLVEVTCKLQFPPILRVETDTPDAFQEIVRHNYPQFQVDSTLTLPSAVPKVLSGSFQRDFPGIARRSYLFSSRDRSWTARLSQGDFALTATNYQGWEDFREKFLSAFAALVRTYQPSYFTHVCVRYRNAIRRERLGLDGVPWSELFQTWISGPLGLQDGDDDVASIQTRCVLSLPEQGTYLDATYGLAREGADNTGVFLVDTHAYYEGQKDQDDVIELLNSLNRRAGAFFRWCLTDRLHLALGPVGPAPTPD